MEAAIPKDRWISPEADTLFTPVVPNEKVEEEATLFSANPLSMARTSNPEWPRGAIALVVSNNLPVPAPPEPLASATITPMPSRSISPSETESSTQHQLSLKNFFRCSPLA
jgi:hypothetical protein